MGRLIYGVGINDSCYKVHSRGGGAEWSICPFYMKWKSMLQRGYSEKFKQKNPTYKSTTVHADWHVFTEFKSWMSSQEWRGNQLDKDLLLEGNTEYSPDYCVFVPKYVNVLFTDSRSSRGEYPIGVTWNKKGSYYQMKCGNGDGTRTQIECFNTPESAHEAWILHKIGVVCQTISKYEKESCFDSRVKATLMCKIAKLNQAYKLGLVVDRL